MIAPTGIARANLPLFVRNICGIRWKKGVSVVFPVNKGVSARILNALALRFLIVARFLHPIFKANIVRPGNTPRGSPKPPQSHNPSIHAQAHNMSLAFEEEVIDMVEELDSPPDSIEHRPIDPIELEKELKRARTFVVVSLVLMVW